MGEYEMVPCKICEMPCDAHPQWQKLCRVCGQKREVYAAAALTGLASRSGSDLKFPALIPAMAMSMAEAMVTLDRAGKS